MTNEEIISLNQCGLIPGPGETEEDFLLRVEKVQLKFKEGDWLPSSHWEWVREFLVGFFDVKPLYICAFYSNRSLAPWQGAASWIEGRSLHSIQLRSSLKKGSYLGLYSREEILAHEAIHAARSGFEEGCFEEFFAYMTSEKRWRRILGPIVQRPWEVWPLIASFIAALFHPVGFLAASIWISLGFGRLIQRHKKLKLAAYAIGKVVKSEKKTRAILLRLKDEEILAFAGGENFRIYAEKQTELRWRAIRLAYLT